MRRSSASSNSSSGSSAAVRPVTLSVAATVTPTALSTTADTLPLTFHRLPHGGPGDKLDLADPLGGIGIVTNASADEMREILDVLNADDADAQRRAADEAAEKRRKHREAMVLFRLRKKMNFGDMKKQEQSLQDVLQLKLREYRQLRDRRSSVHPNPHDDATLRKLQDEFADILTVKESLLRENRAMEGVINELAKFQKLVLDEVERQAEDDQHSSASAESSPRKPTSQDTAKPAIGGGEWIQLLENESPIYYVPESDARMKELSRVSFVRSQQLYEDFTAERFEVTETYCLGWRAQHSLMWTPDHKRVLRFRFTRQVPRWFMKLDDYQRLAWPAVTTPELNARLYSTPVHVKVLQWSGDNTFITLRNSPHRDRAVHIRYFASNTQVEFRDEQNRRAYMIHHSILDREPLAQPAPGQQPIIWIKEGTQCMKFTEIEENDTIEIDHCGYMYCPSEEQARYLMVETCSILMRWEQMVVPPRLLTSD